MSSSFCADELCSKVAVCRLVMVAAGGPQTAYTVIPHDGAVATLLSTDPMTVTPVCEPSRTIRLTKTLPAEPVKMKPPP
jgi:hypothetical protein